MFGEGPLFLALDDVATAGIVAILAQTKKIPGVFRINIQPQEAVWLAVFFLAASAASHLIMHFLGLENAKIRAPRLGV